MILIPALFEGAGILSLFRIPIMITKEDIEEAVLDSIGIGNPVWYSVWGSVWVSVEDSVWGSVGNSVRDSVGVSIRNSVGNSVYNSVRDSIELELKEKSL